MKRTVFLTAVFLLSWFNVSYAEILLTTQFVQEKSISAFSTTLKSSGKVMISRENGVIWSQLSPFSVKTVLTNRSIVSFDGEKAKEVVNFENKSELSFIPILMASFFKEDRETLSQYFTVLSEERIGEKKKFYLQPLTPSLRKIFNEVTLVKGEYLETLVLKDALGDITKIVFSGTKTENVSHQRIKELYAIE